MWVPPSAADAAKLLWPLSFVASGTTLQGPYAVLLCQGLFFTLFWGQNTNVLVSPGTLTLLLEEMLACVSFT